MEGDFIMESRISFEPLTNGEGVALGVIEITSIPHLSIIDPRAKIVIWFTNHLLLQELYPYMVQVI